jgi:hypothetical protein
MSNIIRYLAVMALAALVWGGARAQETTQEPNGAWLRSGIDLYQRMNGHDSLSQKDAAKAVIVASYVCAVLDLEKYLLFRADLLKRAVAAGKRRGQMKPLELKGINEALPMLLPLMETRFLADSPSCESVLVMVRDFLVEYPEMLPSDAEMIVEAALVKAYSTTSVP